MLIRCKWILLRHEAGRAARLRPHFFCFAKKSKQKKATRSLDPCAALRATCLAQAISGVSLNSPSAQTTRALVRCSPMPSKSSQNGRGAWTGHRCARPGGTLCAKRVRKISHKVVQCWRSVGIFSEVGHEASRLAACWPVQKMVLWLAQSNCHSNLVKGRSNSVAGIP